MILLSLFVLPSVLVLPTSAETTSSFYYYPDPYGEPHFEYIDYNSSVLGLNVSVRSGIELWVDRNGSVFGFADVLCPGGFSIWCYYGQINVTNKFVWNIEELPWDQFLQKRMEGTYDFEVSAELSPDGLYYFETRTYDNHLVVFFNVSTITSLTERFEIKNAEIISETNKKGVIIPYDRRDISPRETQLSLVSAAQAYRRRQFLQNTAIGLGLVSIIFIIAYRKLRRRSNAD